MNSIFDDDNYNTDKGSEQNEMERYLRDTPTAPTEKTLLENWQSIRQQYPTVARMAKDVLSIAMAGVGVERIFNSGRDTCQYLRGHLHAETIKKIMLVKHADNEQLVDETLLSEVELLMEMKTDDEKRHLQDDNEVGSVEDKLARDCHFKHFLSTAIVNIDAT